MTTEDKRVLLKMRSANERIKKEVLLTYSITKDEEVKDFLYMRLMK